MKKEEQNKCRQKLSQVNLYFTITKQPRFILHDDVRINEGKIKNLMEHSNIE